MNTLPDPLLIEAPYPEEVNTSDMVGDGDPRVDPKVDPSVEPSVLRNVDGANDPNDESRPDKEVANCCISR